MKSKVMEADTRVIQIGMDRFITSHTGKDMSDTAPAHTADVNESKRNKRGKKDGRFKKFVKKHFLQRKSNSNDVKEISIVPEGDELMWARRSAGSAASRSSDDAGSGEENRLEVVHDMAEEYIPDVPDA